MKTIVFFHPSSEMYGSDKILLYIMKRYEGWNRILVLPSQGELFNYVQTNFEDVAIRIESTIPVIAKKNFHVKGMLQFIRNLLLFFGVSKQVLANNPDIVYCNTLAVFPVFFYFRKKRIRKILHVHEILDNGSIIHRIINKLAINLSDFVICVSNAVKRNLEDLTVESQKKLLLIHNGIDFKPSQSRELSFSIDRSKVNFALIGRIKPSHKGQLFLLDAIKKLSPEVRSRSNFYLVGGTVPGQEYMLDALKTEISNSQLDSEIKILPFISDIEHIYHNVDVIIVPSMFEDPFPTTVLEGMYWKKPVIGTKVGGIPEMILNNVSGFIVNKCDPHELAEKIDFFIQNPDLINVMGERGHQYFMDNYSEACFINRYTCFMNEKLSD
ncbi:MAG: glycosyltransferase family 4 protein [Bacteroidales bacterium]